MEEEDDRFVPQKKEEDGDELLESLQYAVGSICQMVEKDDTDSSSSDGVVVGMTWSAIRTLTELVYNYTTNIMSQDLVSFSEHANRKTITLDDVKLMARKNPANLYNQLQELNRYTTTTETTTTMMKKKQHSKLPSPTSNDNTTTNDTNNDTMTLTQIRDTKLQNMDSSSDDDMYDSKIIRTNKRSITNRRRSKKTIDHTNYNHPNNSDDDDDSTNTYNTNIEKTRSTFGMKQTIENRIQPKKFSIFSNTTASSSSSSSSDDDDTEPDIQQPSQKRRKRTIAIDDDDDNSESSNLPKTTTTTVEESSSDQSVIDLSG